MKTWGGKTWLSVGASCAFMKTYYLHQVQFRGRDEFFRLPFRRALRRVTTDVRGDTAPWRASRDTCNTMYASETDLSAKERTKFRLEEKRYQLHREQTFLTRRHKKVAGPLVTRACSLEDAIDLCCLGDIVANGGGIHGVRVVVTKNDVIAFEIPDRPGLLLIPNAIDLQTQKQWLVQSVTTMCEPPAETNHGVRHGSFAGLWDASLENRWLVPEEKNETIHAPNATANRWRAEASSSNTKPEKSAAIAARVLLEKLRWATLGPPYDWSTRKYKETVVYSQVPDDVKRHCKRLAAAAGHPEFKASAGLVNYYRAGDALAGHVDDAERDMTKPIVSFSLGSPCVFLVGGDDRDVEPTAFVLRSGDAVVLSGKARSRFHGVPRVFVENDETTDGHGALLKAPPELSCPETWHEHPDVARYVRGGRVNVSVRDID